MILESVELDNVFDNEFIKKNEKRIVMVFSLENFCFNESREEKNIFIIENLQMSKIEYLEELVKKMADCFFIIKMDSCGDVEKAEWEKLRKNIYAVCSKEKTVCFGAEHI